MGIIKDLLRQSLYGVTPDDSQADFSRLLIKKDYLSYLKSILGSSVTYDTVIAHLKSMRLHKVNPNLSIPTVPFTENEWNHYKELYSWLPSITPTYFANINKNSDGSYTVYVQSRYSGGAFRFNAPTGVSIPKSLVNLENITGVSSLPVNGQLKIGTDVLISAFKLEVAKYLNGKNANSFYTTEGAKILKNQIASQLLNYDPYIGIVTTIQYSELDVAIEFLKMQRQFLFPIGTLNVSNYSNSDLFNLDLSKLYFQSTIISSTISTVKNNKFSNFNFLIAVRDHYVKYQSTAFLFASQGNKDQLSAITSGNFLKLLQTQLAVLTPAKFVRSNSMANKTSIESDLLDLIRLTTMGYLKSGDVITSDLTPYFKVGDDISGILNRINAISTNTNGTVVPPAFVYNTIGSVINSSTVPNGVMMIKLINEILLEADKNFTYLGF